MDKKILQVVYNSSQKVLSQYYGKAANVSKPESLNTTPVNGDVVSRIQFYSDIRGELILATSREASQSLFVQISGAQSSTFSDQAAKANLEFLNILAGMVKRILNKHQMEFTFSLPQGLNGGFSSTSFPENSHDKYLYKLNFRSCSALLVLILEKTGPAAGQIRI